MEIKTYNHTAIDYLQRIKANYINEILNSQNISADILAKATYNTETIKGRDGKNTNFCLWIFTKKLNEKSKPIHIYIIEYITFKQDNYKLLKIVKD